MECWPELGKSDVFQVTSQVKSMKRFSKSVKSSQGTKKVSPVKSSQVAAFQLRSVVSIDYFYSFKQFIQLEYYLFISFHKRISDYKKIFTHIYWRWLLHFNIVNICKVVFDIEALCWRIRNPLCENTRSTGADVAGTQRTFIASQSWASQTCFKSQVKSSQWKDSPSQSSQVRLDLTWLGLGAFLTWLAQLWCRLDG